MPWTASADRADVRARLLALPGIGPWTADYVAMRALGDPDVFLPTDIGVRRALAALGDDPRGRGRSRAVAPLALLRACCTCGRPSTSAGPARPT